MGQSVGFLVTPPSISETGKGAVLALGAAAGIAPLVTGITSVNRTTLSRSLQRKHPNVSGTSLPFSTISVSLVDRDFQTNNQPATILQTTAPARWLDAVHILWLAVIWGVV